MNIEQACPTCGASLFYLWHEIHLLGLAGLDVTVDTVRYLGELV